MQTNSLTLLEQPAGIWSFVGRVPESLAYRREDGQPLTDKERKTIKHCGPGFCRDPKVSAVTFESEEQALHYACAMGHQVHRVCPKNRDPYTPETRLKEKQ